MLLDMLELRQYYSHKLETSKSGPNKKQHER